MASGVLPSGCELWWYKIEPGRCRATVCAGQAAEAREVAEARACCAAAKGAQQDAQARDVLEAGDQPYHP